MIYENEIVNPPIEVPAEIFNGGITSPQVENLEVELGFLITEQPKQYFRFRYAKENDSTHGVLSGASSISKSDNIFPSVKLIAPHYEQEEFFIQCALYEPQPNPPTAPEKLSPHMLYHKKAKTYAPIFQKMTQSLDTPSEFAFELRDYFIVRTKKENRISTLERQYQALLRCQLGGNVTLNEIQKRQIAERVKQESSAEEGGGGRRISGTQRLQTSERVCLGFTVYTKYPSQAEYLVFIGPMFSSPIINDEIFKILKLCNTHGNIEGGDEITFLVSDAKPDNIQGRIFEIDGTNTTIWEAPLTVQDVHKNAAVSFKTPGFDEKRRTQWPSQVECMIELKRLSDKCTSQPIKFFYINYNPVTSGRKRSRLNSNKRLEEHSRDEQSTDNAEGILLDSMENSTYKREPKVVKEERPYLDLIKAIRRIAKKKGTNNEQQILDEIDQLNESYADEHRTGNTIFHDTIANGDFLKLYKLPNNLKLNELYCDAFNDQGESLLHYACKLNKADYIRLLVGYGCSIAAQDSSGRTPLHIAIQMQHHRCTKRLRELIGGATAFPKVAEDLRKVFRVYNRQGYTALHLAVLHDQRTLVVDMLQFARAANIAAGAIEVLGNGNTILHLAVSRGLIEVAKLIVEHAPEVCTMENYEGLRAEIPKEMTELIEMVKQSSLK